MNSDSIVRKRNMRIHCVERKIIIPYFNITSLLKVTSTTWSSAGKSSEAADQQKLIGGQ
jgi:hypothetical protein